MTTNTPGGQARLQPRQLINTIRFPIAYNDVGIANGVAKGAALPLGAFVTRVLVEVVTAFNAATTNVLTAGKTAAGTELVAAGDVDLTTVGVYDVTRSVGSALARSADIQPYAKYAQTGAAATAGAAIMVIQYEGNTG